MSGGSSIFYYFYFFDAVALEECDGVFCYALSADDDGDRRRTGHCRSCGDAADGIIDRDDLVLREDRRADAHNTLERIEGGVGEVGHGSARGDGAKRCTELIKVVIRIGRGDHKHRIGIVTKLAFYAKITQKVAKFATRISKIRTSEHHFKGLGLGGGYGGISLYQLDFCYALTERFRVIGGEAAVGEIEG